MEKIWKSVLSCFVLALLCTYVVEAQSSNDNKEVIIIEKVVDENGNVISKKIVRSSNGDLSDEEIEKALKESSKDGINSFFDFDNLGLQDLERFNFGDMGLFDSQDVDAKPTLGVSLSFETGEAVITDVSLGSGAEDADLRKGDIIISADGLVVNTIDEIREYLSDKKEGDKVLLSIVRDGQTFDQKVELKNNNFGGAIGGFDPSQFKEFGKMFNFGEEGMPLNIDSLFGQINRQNEGRKMPFNFNLPNYSDKTFSENKPSLGVFVDDTNEGVVIAEVIEDSAASKAKLKPDDIIKKIDGIDINSFDDLSKMVRAAGKNTKIVVTYLRNGKEKKTEVLLK